MCGVLRIMHPKIKKMMNETVQTINLDDYIQTGEAIKRLLPYYATKVPYMFDMAFNAPMLDVALQKNVNLLLRS